MGAIQNVCESWQLGELLQKFPRLALSPIVGSHVRIAGIINFSAQFLDLEQIEDEFEVAIDIPQRFPQQLPKVTETAGRIPRDFHINLDSSLCLGSPTRQRLALSERPTLLTFIQKCVIPYLYAFSYFQKYGVLPFGDLAHGLKGIRQDYASLFGVKDEDAAGKMVRLASMKKRSANKYPCPCGSGRRVGKCHNRRINQLRKQLGRSWFASEYRQLIG